jgi:hypothetical protein
MNIIYHVSVPTLQKTQFDSIRDKVFREMVVSTEHITTIILIVDIELLILCVFIPLWCYVFVFTVSVNYTKKLCLTDTINTNM